MIYSRQPRPWPAWVSLALLVISLLPMAVGLWISCWLGQAVYQSCLQVKDDPQIADAWQVIRACRVVSWGLLPVSLMQLGLGIGTVMALRGSESPGRSRRLKRLFTGMVLGLVVLLAMEAYWVTRMAPVAGLIRPAGTLAT